MVVANYHLLAWLVWFAMDNDNLPGNAREGWHVSTDHTTNGY